MNFPLPVWAVRIKAADAALTKLPCELPSDTIAFTEVSRALRFIESRATDTLKVQQIANDQDLMILVMDLHRQGVHGICVDPNPDGSGGELFTIADMLVVIAAKRNPSSGE